VDERSANTYRRWKNRNVLMKIEFYKHNLDTKDKRELKKTLDSLFLTTGDKVKEFEAAFASYVGAKYAVGMTSCTNALELALKYYDVRQGDEVITTPMSFIATANAAEYCGAKPIFVDVESNTGNIDVSLVEKAITKRTKAIIPVHLYGQMCDMKALRKLANKYDLKIIEDAAHCVEGERDGVKVGQLGDIACYSFYATKNLTSGEGGAISCNNKKIYEWMLSARQHGMTKNAADRYSKRYEHYDMEFLGNKCNMSNLQAALLVNQIKRLDGLLIQKNKLADKYDKGFTKNKYIKMPAILKGSRHARHLYTIWVNPQRRDEYMSKIQEAGIGIAVNFRPIHLMKYYREKYGCKRGDYPITEMIGDSTITIPFYPKLTQKEIKYIIGTINHVINE